jgi:hypothetical protein
MKNIITLFVFLFLFRVLYAQTLFIDGRITDLGSIPIPNASIMLCSSDSILHGTISGVDGTFFFININTNDYTVKIHSLGYYTKTIDLSIKKESINLGDILLETAAQELSSVEIMEKKDAQFGDKKVYYPNEIDRQSSSSALDVTNLIPKFMVEPGNQQLVTVKGDQVKILINGINATETDLSLIAPEDISKVEYYDNPPTRYALIGVGAVVNVITKQPITTGGQIAMNLQNGINSGHGNDVLGVKCNVKNSVFGLKYRFRYKDQSQRVVDESLMYQFDNIGYEKKKNGKNSPFKYNDHLVDFNFVNQKAENYLFSAKISLLEFSQKIENFQTLEQTRPVIINGYSYNKEKNNYLSPTADLYFEKRIEDNQNIFVNVVGTFYNTDFSNDYIEYTPQDTEFQSFVNVLGKKYSAISDLVYEYSWEKSKFSSGVRYMYAKSLQNISTKDTEELSSQTQDVYGYMELSGNISDFSYSISAGVNHNLFDSYELKKTYAFTFFRPNINLYYTKGKSTFSLTAKINTYNPLLSELSSIPVMQDAFFAYSGNSELKPYNKYITDFSYEYSQKNFLLWANLFFEYAKNPFRSYFIMESEYILQTYINLDYAKEYGFSTYLQWFPFESKWLRLRVSGTILETINENLDMTWSYVSYRVIPSCVAKYKKWGLSLFYQSLTETLKGQTLKSEPSFASIELSYKPINNMSIIAGIRNPFYSDRKYVTSTQDVPFLSRYLSESIRDNSNMIYLQFVYTLSFGKQTQDYRKKLQNEDTDSGVFKME